MYEPHLTGYENQQDMKSFDGSGGGEKVVDLLAELDKIAPIKSFDAFPKVSRRAAMVSRFERERWDCEVMGKVRDGEGGCL